MPQTSVQTSGIPEAEPARRRRRRPDHRLRQPAPRVLPLQPLLDVTGLTRTGVKRVVRASGADVRRAATDGLTAAQADIWAHRCGFHAGEVWGAEWWEVEAA